MCNVSRGIVPALRRRYACVAVVLVTAPAEVLANRLAGRGRASDGDIARRVARAAPPEAELSPDHVIQNVADLEQSAAETRGGDRRGPALPGTVPRKLTLCYFGEPEQSGNRSA